MIGKKNKIKDKKIYYKHWQTPLSGAQNLWLSSVLQTKNRIHFFFQLGKEDEKKIHVMTIYRSWPYRVTDEEYTYGSIPSDNFSKGINLTAKKFHKKKFLRTWKFWNTSFVKEIEGRNNSLSNYSHKRDLNLYQYLINTQEEVIEFISLFEPTWKVHKNKKISSLLSYYSKKTRES